MKKIISFILAVILMSSVMPLSVFAVSKLPAPTVSVTCVASTGKIKVKWSEVSGAVRYQVYRAKTKDGSYSLVNEKTGTSYINTSAAAGKTYYYKVRAVASDGAKGTFSAIKYRTCDLPRPVVTGSLSINGYPKLKWSAIDGAKSYQVYRATTKNGTYKLMKTTASTSYTNTASNPDRKYFYKVKALSTKSAADSAYSTVMCLSTRKITVSKSFVTLNSGETAVIDVSGCGDSMTFTVDDKNIADGTWGEWYEDSNTIPLTIKAVSPGTAKMDISYTDNQSQIYKTIEITVKDACNGKHSTRFGYCDKCGNLRTELCETANEIIGKFYDGNSELEKAIEYIQKGLDSTNPQKSTQYQKALKYIVNARDEFNLAKKYCKSYAEFAEVKTQFDKIAKALYDFTQMDTLTYDDMNFTVDVLNRVVEYENNIYKIFCDEWFPIMEDAGYVWE